jgi:hypothetical protein
VTRQKHLGNETRPTQRAPGNLVPYDPQTEATFAGATFFRDLDRKHQEQLWQSGKVSRYIRNKIVVSLARNLEGLSQSLSGSVQLYRRHGQRSELIGTFHEGRHDWRVVVGL